jgi:hypothetical protein
MTVLIRRTTTTAAAAAATISTIEQTVAKVDRYTIHKNKVHIHYTGTQ